MTGAIERTMVTTRKRKRPTMDQDSTQSCTSQNLNHNADIDMEAFNEQPPFAPAHISLYNNHRNPLSRTLTTGNSPLIVNLLIITAHRLQQRDYESAASVLPVLIKRYYKLINSTWSCSREIAIAGTHVLKYGSSANNNPAILDDFLSHIVQDRNVMHVGADQRPQNYTEYTREAALFEKVLNLLGASKFKSAFDTLYSNSQEAGFRNCSVIQGYLGILALALANNKDLHYSPSFLIRISINCLNHAANLNPHVFMYRYYSMAIQLTLGNNEQCIQQLKHLLQTPGQDAMHPIVLNSLLSLYYAVPEGNRVKEEMVDVSRKLLYVDPYHEKALNTLREAHSWQWEVGIKVSTLELAMVYANRIEGGSIIDLNNWIQLGTHLSQSSQDRFCFWFEQGRNIWWPSHFFRPTRISSDFNVDPQLGAVKASVSRMLTFPNDCPYVQAVVSSGVVELYPFEIKS